MRLSATSWFVIVVLMGPGGSDATMAVEEVDDEVEEEVDGEEEADAVVVVVMRPGGSDDCL